MDITELQRVSSSAALQRHPWEIARASIVAFLLKKYCTTPLTTIVDIGGGDAFVASYLLQQKMADSICTIDTAYTPDLIQSLQSKNPGASLQFYEHIDQLAPVPTNANTAVLILDVLEHIEDPSALLQKALRPDLQLQQATWIITVPAYNALFSQHDTLLGHYKRYTIRTLTHLLQKQGFHIKKTGYFFFSLLMVRILHLFLERIGARSVKTSIDAWRGSPLLSRLLTGMLKLDFLMGFILNKIGLKIPGLSCYTICRPLR